MPTPNDITALATELYILVDALDFINSICDPLPDRTLAWILSKLDRCRSYRRACEIPEWDAEICLTDCEDKTTYPAQVEYVLSAW